MRALTAERAAELDEIARAAKAIIQSIDDSNLQQSIDEILELLPQDEQDPNSDAILNASDFTYLSQHYAHDLLMALATHWPGDVEYNPAHAIPMRLGVQHELDQRIIQATQVSVEADQMGFYESITKVFMSSYAIWQTFPDLRVGGAEKNTVLISLIKGNDNTGAYSLELSGALAIVKAGATLDERNAQNETALICAAQHGDLNLIQAMLQKNSDSDFVDAQDAMGNTALIRAILRQRNSDIIEALLKAGANPDIQDELDRIAQDSAEPSYESSQIDSTSITNMLSGYALIRAAQSGNLDGVTALSYLDSTTPTNTTDATGRTALSYASEKGNIEIATLLINEDNITSIDIPDANGCTALIYAAVKGHTDIVGLLAPHTTAIDKTDANGRTALIYAAANGHTDIVGLLAPHTTAIDKTDAQGCTALIHAAANGHTAIVGLLAPHTTAIDKTDAQGCTALIYAAAKRHTAIVGLLAPHTTAIDQADTHSRTALMYAAKNGDTETVQALLSNGASANATDRQGHTALNYAQENEAIIEILLASTAEEQTSGPDDKAPSPPPSITDVLSQRAGGGAAPVATPLVRSEEQAGKGDKSSSPPSFS